MKTLLILIGCGGLGYWLLTRIAWGKEQELAPLPDRWLKAQAAMEGKDGVEQVCWTWPVNKLANDAGRWNRAKEQTRRRA